VVGIEPTSSAWKAEVLPLNYTRLTSFIRLFEAYKNPDSLFSSNCPDSKILCITLTTCVSPLFRKLLYSFSACSPPNALFNKLSGGGGRIRTYVGISQQIYSLPSLAA
jgi:hypothetical protein